MRERRGNLFDLLILLTVAFCIFGGIGRFFEVRAQANKVGQEAILTLSIPETEALFMNCINEGEAVYLASGEDYGTVEALRSSAAHVEMLGEDGFVSGEWKDGTRWEVHTEIRISGTFSEGIFLHEGRTAVLVGQYLSLYTERAYLYGMVTEVRLLTEE